MERGKRGVSDEGMYEEEGLLSGLRGRGPVLDEEEEEEVESVSQTFILGRYVD